MDLSTTYMGFQLPHPLIPGASPMVDNLDTVKRLEDGGASLIVMHSLFEEQIVNEELYFTHAMEHADFSTPEAMSYFPRPAEFVLGTDEYLEQIYLLKRAVAVPVIASLNGTTYPAASQISMASRVLRATPPRVPAEGEGRM